MSHYTPKKIRPWSLVGMLFRAIGNLLSIWPLLLVVAFFVSPIGPHLRVQYTYEQRGPYHQQMLDCDYLGSRGFVKYMEYGECPFIAFIDRRVIN